MKDNTILTRGHIICYAVDRAFMCRDVDLKEAAETDFPCGSIVMVDEDGAVALFDSEVTGAEPLLLVEPLKAGQSVMTVAYKGVYVNDYYIEDKEGLKALVAASGGDIRLASI